MVPKEEIEAAIEHVLIEKERRRTKRNVFLIFTLLSLFVFSTIAFVLSTVLLQSEHEANLVHATKVAQAAQRESNGNKAMIFAVCRAFHRRDVMNQQKWRDVTDIEIAFPRPNNSALDAAYHAARRKMLVKEEAADTNILSFDCIKGMEKAYSDGAKSDAPQNLRPISADSITTTTTTTTEGSKP